MTQTEIPGFPARRAALKILDAVLRQGKPLESALEAATQNVRIGPDRSLARAIASETLRWMPDLDGLIDGVTRQRLPDDSKARMVLRLALVQALKLGTPPHAAIATALPLVMGGPRRLVHGVLGTILRKGAQLPETPNLPEDVVARWQAAWGDQMVAEARAALSEVGMIDLTLKNHSETSAWLDRLAGSSLMPGHVRISGDSDIPSLPGYEDGAWWVQNLSASVPARLLGQGEGRSVLDLCAAPGGKAMQLASQGWQVTAIENNTKRIERLRDNLQRTGLEANFVTADILKWQPESQVDAILLDAPCSATGIFARHPDVLYRVGAKQIAQMAELQAKMFSRASQWLKPGGQLVYATCSLEPSEGEAIEIPSNLKRVSIDQTMCPPDTIPDGDGALRILPKHNMQGFYILLCTTS